MRAEPVAGDGSGASTAAAADTAASESDSMGPEPESEEQLDPELEAVLDELRGTNVNEVPPIELLAKVQEWQERLDE